MPFFKKSQTIALFLIIIIFLSGCILFRFLEFRDQLKKFEQNFGIDDQDGLELIFKKPVLKDSDIVWLMSTEPVYKRPVQKDIEIWTYNFIKRYQGRKSEKGNFNIPVKMKYENGLLTSMTFPDRFLKYFSKELFGKFMESMGETRVSKLDKSSNTKIKKLREQDIPDAEQIKEMLGEPYSSESKDEFYSYTYRYIYRNMEDRSKFYGLKFILNFDEKTNRMKELKANIKFIDMTVDFSDVL